VVAFYLKKPKRAITLPTVKPDIDKLCRAILDALTDSGAIFDDDSQVVQLVASKNYSTLAQPYVVITVLNAVT
jgi:Holliday junction resolvase RusA-like endonuclease